MELGGIEVVLVQGRAIRENVIRGCRGKFIQWYIEAMYEVNEFFLVETLEQIATRIGQCVPSHVRHFVLVAHRLEFLHVDVEDAQAIRIALFRVSAHQLHAEADTQYRLLQVLD